MIADQVDRCDLCSIRSPSASPRPHVCRTVQNTAKSVRRRQSASYTAESMTIKYSTLESACLDCRACSPRYGRQ